jgi:uncharacterized RDD family membrane protein YckC
LGPSVIALIIDNIITTIVAWIIITILLVPLVFTGVLLILARMEKPSSSPLISGILEVIYFAFFEVSMGATIGQEVLGLEVQILNGSNKHSNIHVRIRELEGADASWAAP